MPKRHTTSPRDTSPRREAKPDTKPELSRPLKIDKIPASGLTESILASNSECASVALRLDVVAIKRLAANLHVDHASGRMIAVTGTWSADVVQICVDTLEQLETRYNGSIDTLFSTQDIAKLNPNTIGDDIEEIIDGKIDLGELLVQHLAVDLDPYPRKPKQ